MSHLDDLTAKLCPDGVPHRPLGVLGEFIRGNGLQKADLTDEGSPAIHYGQIHTHYGVWADSTKSFTDPGLATRLRRARPGDLIIATTSEDDAAVAKATAWLGEGEVAVSGDAYIYRHSLDPRYVAYFFQSQGFQDQKKRLISGTKVRRISGTSLAKITVPVPPLKVQREVVTVLDTLADLEAKLKAELKAELEARWRQYATYRDTIIFGCIRSSFPPQPLGELGEFVRGRRFTWGDVADDGVPAIHYSEIYTHFGSSATVAITHVRRDLADRLRLAKPKDVLIASVGETVEDLAKAVAWLGDTPVAIHDDMFAFTSSINPKFVAYCLQTKDFQSQISGCS